MDANASMDREAGSGADPMTLLSIAQEGARLAEKATPGPWQWNVSLRSKQVYLVGNPKRGCEYVMDFVRYGMDGAAPRFRNADCLMVHSKNLAVAVEGREHHADWYRTIEHPDAEFIAHAGTHYAALCRAVIDAETARASAFEEAAKVVDGFAQDEVNMAHLSFPSQGPQVSDRHRKRADVAREIARAIRSQA